MVISTTDCAALRVIPVFSVDPEKGRGYSEETKPMLNTSHGFVPWDDLHHTEVSQTNGEIDVVGKVPGVAPTQYGPSCVNAGTIF